MRCLVAGTVRNIAGQWGVGQQSLDRIFSALDDYVCVLVESNSSDSTVSVIQQWCRKAPQKRYVISLGNLSEPVRTKRIATSRNAYMDFFQQNKWFDQFDYMLVVDIDSLQIDSNFKKQLESCLTRTDWDGIASNRHGQYYDIWALRSRAMGCTFDCWDMVNRSGGDVNTYVRRFQQVIPAESAWIPCESAFGCMALYKTQSVRNHRYNGDSTCEHVSFHFGFRMFINPAFFSGFQCDEHIIKTSKSKSRSKSISIHKFKSKSRSKPLPETMSRAKSLSGMTHRPTIVLQRNRSVMDVRPVFTAPQSAVNVRQHTVNVRQSTRRQVTARRPTRIMRRRRNPVKTIRFRRMTTKPVIRRR